MNTLPPRPASPPRQPRRRRRQDRSVRISETRKEKWKSTLTDDFIPFADSSSSEAEQRAHTPPVREWDLGKRASPDWRRGRERSREREANGRKRKHDTAFDDGYENKKQRTDAASRKAPWLSDVDWESCNNVAEMLHREVEAFVKYISPTPVEDEVRGLVVKLIAKAVTNAFPDAQVLPFGSFETKLYLPLGDIDLVILSDSMAYSNKSNVLHALANTIKRAQLADKVTIIAKAKVPIIKFITTHGRFNVDISINQANGITAGRIINGFLQHLQSTALRSIVMVTKTFLNQRSMNEVFTGGLGSYSIVCLAVSFLQMHPKIRRGEIDANKNLGVLVMEFFELYGCYFNYEEVGISVRDGGTYFNKRQRGWLDYSKNNLLSIEDPADPFNDISRGTFAIAKVRTTFAGAHGILTAAAYLRAGIITARREGRSLNLRGRYCADDMSILSSVLGVTQETINHRKLVQEVYDKRTLHHMLGVSAKETVTPPISAPCAPNGTSAKPNSSSRRAAESVESAWEQADAGVESDDRKHSGLGSRRWGEDEGRYGIRQKRPRENWHMGRNGDALFTTDEDEDRDAEDVPITEYVRGSDEEEDESSLVAHDAAGVVDGSSEAAERRRSYWLSKAIITVDSD